MPPRHGQSQFMTPVSSLNAPSWEASDSRFSGFERPAVWGVVVGVDDSAVGAEEEGGWTCLRREEAMDSSVGRGVSSVGDWGCGTTTKVSPLAAFRYFSPWTRTHKVAPQQIDCWCYSNRLLLSPDPIVQRYFSSFVTFELVARWRVSDGLEVGGGAESIVVGGGKLAVSL